MNVNFSQINRRRFLVGSGMFTAAVWSSPIWLAQADAEDAKQSRWVLDLGGNWQVARAETKDWISATVPGCIHTDLLAAGKIPNPFFRDNEKLVQWVGDATWVYQRSFDVPPEALQYDRVLLRCEGLDTLAVVKVNDNVVARTDNMFRTWEFDAKPLLKPGTNTIEISFVSPFPTIKERQAGRTLYEWSGPLEPKGRAWVRKEPCNFGWDWAPVLVTCGIWRPIGVLAFNHARLADLRIQQNHAAYGKVELQIEVDAEVVRPEPVHAIVEIRHADRPLHVRSMELANGSATVSLPIDNPKLWWPAGMGAQPLYEVRVELRDDAGDKVLDRAVKRIGLRVLKLLPPDQNNSLRFEVNGVQFFAKGANLIPADAFANRVTSGILQRLASDAVAVNMNALRFWGGGYYEDDALFDACDELGLCVWLDFKFACSSYPAFDNDFMENVKQEARDQLRRLRHHPCIAVWCGNNEIGLMTKDQWSDESMGRADYDKMFKELLGGLVAELAPQANYVSGSPDCGDVHNWKVWHGGALFENYRTLNGFMSEFGFQSFPGPKTVCAYTEPADQESILTPVMQWHERSGTSGVEIIRDMIPHYFKAPKDFESTLWLSQIVQAYGIKIGAEHWRRTMPKSMGCLFWQYNDCWPVASWSSVDYYGRWKALHYFARRFYAPLLVSLLENAADSTMEVHVSSDQMDKCTGKLFWRATDVAGKTLSKGDLKTEIAPHQSALITTLKLDRLTARHGANNVLVWVKLEVDGKVASENFTSFVPPKDLPLVNPELKAAIKRKNESYLVTLAAKKPALWCWLDLPDADATYSENFVHVTPDHPVEILVTPHGIIEEAEFRNALQIRSVFDVSSADARNG